ncbi:MAG: WYL domain-containing protein [Gammaproteobacteria bacterium]|nr:WYL domain-containing protein [Gammaproteobacteria bacterium]
MDRTERFYLIDQMLHNQQVVSRAQFLDTLEVSPATFKRDLEYLRDRMAAPIIWDNQLRGYRYDRTDTVTAQYQLPGLWFNTSEIQALLSMDALLENLQPGVLSSHIEPLRTRIRVLLDKGDHSVDEIARRIRIIPSTAKTYRNENFQLIVRALLTRSQLHIDYYGRTDDNLSHRHISPQRLIYYRDNWYLDSWCHLREALRSFAVDAIESLTLLTAPALDIDDVILSAQLESGYGIFSGTQTRRAVLRFAPNIARWVSKEQWHPQQQGKCDQQGYYLLTIPYSQDTELVMDILRYGEEVEVLRPISLRKKLVARIESMRQVYTDLD